MSSVFVLLICVAVSAVLSDETDYNVINSDGTFSFGLSNNDEGGHYHSGSKSANNVERGKFGSRNPATGRIEETVYTAGPRGYRARGPSIHRKMDLSQVSRGPTGSIDDPLADPFDNPSYGFRFRSNDQQRREDADRTGHVNGLYSYLDDVGERHSVRYAAGSDTGYQVSNAVPDTPSLVRYSAPLYKTNRNARGRISYERGPGAQYKFIASGPDQRRSESTGSDGITRGSYSYLDDKGVQRTVEYIAGAGIGYRIVQSTTGTGTHLVPRPAIPEFSVVPPQSNDITDDDGTGFKVADSGSVQPNRNRNSGNFNSNPSSSGGNRDSAGNRRGDNRQGNSGKSSSENIYNDFTAYEAQGSNENALSSRPDFLSRGSARFPENKDSSKSGSSGSSGSSGKQHNLKQNSDSIPPYVTNIHHTLEKDRNTDWTNNGRDSTLVKNVGNWYVGLPPGSAVRAHVQSIDLLPLGGRPPSPGDALRRDEHRSIK